jgi:NhaP-type Na+/H+ or K+/H+ antiporter
VNKVSFGPASWIGLIGAIAAALAPVFSSLPVSWGATIAAILSSVVILGRQLQAMVNTIYGDGVVIEDLALVDEIPDAPTDAPVIG